MLARAADTMALITEGAGMLIKDHVFHDIHVKDLFGDAEIGRFDSNPRIAGWQGPRDGARLLRVKKTRGRDRVRPVCGPGC